jgi:DNA/RNA endonuclease YhcR with UshA esterase domain
MSGTGKDNGNYPVCGPQVKRPLRVRVLQYASLVLAVAGLVLLYLYSVNRGIPVVRVSEITPTMNFATVRIIGEVTRDTYMFKSGGIVFNINDGSGEIAVMGGRAQADALEAAGKRPRRGDQVDVAGSLSVSADQEVKLRIQSADQLLLTRKRAAPSYTPAGSRIKLTDVTADLNGEQVLVIGALTSVDIPGPGSKAPYALTLEEDGATRTVIFWDDVFQGLEQTLPLPGNLIRAAGTVDVYKGTVQLKVRDAADLSVVTEQEKLTTPAERPIRRVADIAAEQAGDIFTVSGTLGEPRSIRGGVIYPLTDGSGEIAVLFWDKQVSGDERAALESGVRVRVTAPLVVYKGTLELVPVDEGGFRVEPAQ